MARKMIVISNEILKFILMLSVVYSPIVADPSLGAQTDINWKLCSLFKYSRFCLPYIFGIYNYPILPVPFPGNVLQIAPFPLIVNPTQPTLGPQRPGGSQGSPGGLGVPGGPGGPGVPGGLGGSGGPGGIPIGPIPQIPQRPGGPSIPIGPFPGQPFPQGPGGPSPPTGPIPNIPQIPIGSAPNQPQIPNPSSSCPPIVPVCPPTAAAAPIVPNIDPRQGRCSLSLSLLLSKIPQLFSIQNLIQFYDNSTDVRVSIHVQIHCQEYRQ